MPLLRKREVVVSILGRRKGVSLALLLEHPLRETEGRALDHRLCHTKDVKDGISGYLAWRSALYGNQWLPCLALSIIRQSVNT